jgi:hypothetical protein
MRISQLRQYADRILNEDKWGSYRDKKYRFFVIHHVIDALFAVGDVPPKWHALTEIHLKKLIGYWNKHQVAVATQLKYMTVIRRFLNLIDHSIIGIDNQSLGLYQKLPSKKRPLISINILDAISNPIAQILLALQIHFGLTLSEGMRLLPNVHIQPHGIWLTREITFNSQDRVIPIRSEKQQSLLNTLINLTGGEHSLIESHGYDAIRYAYRQNLLHLKISPRYSYRRLYAQSMYKELSTILSSYELTLLLLREMGLQSRVTLWGYLRE